ncbi:LOG family protein [Kibdelosporangium philippinense]|uniref:LOG family protein n=1 Tax=Kibdelosporangium philippinense TaxID=211113 RepID=A0ABS8ZVL3_9PSEU|nr:LOG family protein [Kibdelosporangium philippinense]MCE7011780.1 LOG family protein [Kibdelosporangium philippinense]
MANAAHRTRTATFFGGVVPASDQEEELAYGIGLALGDAGLVVQHGGYNGLMEQAARGAAARDGQVVAVTLTNVDWGEFNPYVTESVRLSTMGERFHRFLDNTDLVVAMGGGVGTLHELTAALWYAGNIRAVPVWLAGETALRLLAFLKAERWLFESPTRPLGFLREIPDLATFERELSVLLDSRDRRGDLDSVIARGRR